MVAAPFTVNKAGYVKSSSGATIPSATINLTLWDSATGGNCLFWDTCSIVDSIFRCDLEVPDNVLTLGVTFYWDHKVNGEDIDFDGNERQAWTATFGSGAYFSNNVGIKDSSPDYELDVNGDINVQNNICIDDVCIDTWGTVNISMSADTIYDSDHDTNITVEKTEDDDHVWLYTDGTERLTVDNTDNIGIGDDTPSHKLDVNGNVHSTGTVYADAFSSNSPLQLQTGGTNRIYVEDTGGKVGIGTDTPGEKLHVNGKLKVNDNIVLNGQWVSGDGGNEGVFVATNGNVGIADNTPSYELDVTGQINAQTGLCINGDCKASWDGSAGVPDEMWDTDTDTGIQTEETGDEDIIRFDTGGIEAMKINAAQNLDMLNHYVSNLHDPMSDQDAATKKYVDDNIDSNQIWSINGNNAYYNTGNVGIGTNSPSNKLHVYNSGGGDTWAQLESGSHGAGVRLVGSTGNPSTIYQYGGQDDIRFQTSSTDRMIIQSDGDVGIGTTAPSTRLQVSQSGNAGNQMIISNTLTAGNTLALGCGDSGLINQLCWIGEPYSNGDTGYDNGLYVGVSDSSGYAFQVVSDATSRLYVERDGDVGIGTTTPRGKLNVKTTASGTTDLLYLETSDATQSNEIGMVFNNGVADVAKIRGYVGETGNNGGGIKFVLRDGSDGSMDEDVVFKKTGTEGRVGIGTTNPGYKLDVNGDINTEGDLCISDDCVSSWASVGDGHSLDASDGTPTDAVYVDANGDVGIGTTSPEVEFDIDGPNGVSLDLTRNDAVIDDNAHLGAINFVGYETSRQIGARIVSSAKGHWSTEDTPADLAFYTSPNSGTLTFRAIIDRDGNVGIGTSTPGEKLDVNGKIRAVEICDEFGSNCKDISNGWASDGHSLDAADGDPDDVVFVTNVGNVGIGTTSPGAKLDVRGSAIFNEEGGNNDFRVEGDNDANLLFMDASANKVGIGTSSPSVKLHLNQDTLLQLRMESSSYTVDHNLNSGYYSIDHSSFSEYPFEASYDGYVDIHADKDLTLEADDDIKIMPGSGDSITLYENVILNELPGISDDFPVCWTASKLGLCGSSEKLKENIKPVEYGIEKVMKMNPSSFVWKRGENETNNFNNHSIGFIAQDVATIIPELAIKANDGEIVTVNYNGYTAVLTKAIQDQQSMIDDLQKQNKELTQMVQKLIENVEQLKLSQEK